MSKKDKINGGCFWGNFFDAALSLCHRCGSTLAVVLLVAAFAAGATCADIFSVSPPSQIRSDWDQSALDRLKEIVGEHDPVVIQLSVDPLVYCGQFLDALRILDLCPQESFTPYLQRLRGHCQQQVGDGAVPSKMTETDPVKLSEQIYRLINNEKWEVATQLAERLQELVAQNPNAEIEALYHLYQGMIIAEAGLTRFYESYPLFDKATQILDDYVKGNPEREKAAAASRFRIASRYGDYLLQLTRYRISNHTLAIGAGDDSVFTDVWFAWTLASDMYGKAMRIAEKFLADQPLILATSRINVARLYSLRGNIVRTFHQTRQDRQRLTTFNVFADVSHIEALSQQRAAELASQVISLNLQDDSLNGTAHLLLARFAYRPTAEKSSQDDYRQSEPDFDQCRAEALAAREHFLRAGKLSQIAQVESLLARLANQEQDTAGELKHLLIADIISEILRDSIPADELGLNRAGASSRRASSKERLMGLLLREDRPLDAVTVLETAKARALRDALVGHTAQSNADTAYKPKSVEAIIADLPKGTAVLEYYIGRENCFGFLILNGEITPFPIACYDSGLPLPTTEVIALVLKCLQREIYLATTLTREVIAEPKGKLAQLDKEMKAGEFNRSWEQELLKLRTSLLPDMILEQIRLANTETVLVIPHHVLHYLPFAALVVEPEDKATANSAEMPQPRFLLDERFTVYYAPSLIAWDTIQHRQRLSSNSVTAIGVSEFSDPHKYGRLPGVQKDIENAKKVFGKQRVATITEDDATKNAVTKVLGEPGLLLVGTHGNNDPLRPLNSYLVLRSGTGDNDKLTAEDVFRNNVNKDIIVLSACYSGLAEHSPMPGDDLFGIQRALLKSGARAVVSGMWAVYDITGPDIVKNLMTNLEKGMPAAAALAKAQRTFLKEQRNNRKTPENYGAFAHPYFWAVYTLTGDGQVTFPATLP